MRKKIDFSRYCLRKDLGFTIRYIQDGIEFDQDGWSLKDFPEPREFESEVLLDENVIVSKRGQPYKTLKAARENARRKKLDLDKCEFLNFKGGVVIKYEKGSEGS